MKKKYKKIGLWLILLLSIIFLMVGRTKYYNQKCVNIKIDIENPNIRFVTEEQVKNYILEHYQGKIIGEPFKKINELKIAQILENNPYITDVKISHSPGKLEIKIKQAVPIVKIITKEGEFYLDTKGNIMSAKTGYSPYILVANGNINHSFKLPVSQKINLQSLDKEKNSAIFSIFAVAKYVNQSKFWRDFITQIYVKDTKTIILTPRFGDFIIILGDTTNLEDKFFKLNTFLNHIDKIGWNRYSAINLKYNNQIVCVKK